MCFSYARLFTLFHYPKDKENIVLDSMLGRVLIVGISFGTWPAMVRVGGLSTNISTFLVAAGTLVGSLFLVRGGESFPVIGLPVLLVLAAGVVNLIGLQSYNALFTGQWEISRTVPMALTLTFVVAVLWDMVKFGEPVTVIKIGGIAACVLGILLLNK